MQLASRALRVMRLSSGLRREPGDVLGEGGQEVLPVAVAHVGSSVPRQGFAGRVWNASSAAKRGEAVSPRMGGDLPRVSDPRSIAQQAS